MKGQQRGWGGGFRAVWVNHICFILLAVSTSLSILFALSEPTDLDKKNTEIKIDETGKFILLLSLYFNFLWFLLFVNNHL